MTSHSRIRDDVVTELLYLRRHHTTYRRCSDILARAGLGRYTAEHLRQEMRALRKEGRA